MENTYFILSHYIQHAMEIAEFELLEDDTYAGKVAICEGVVAFGKSKLVCEQNLQATLESWLLLRLKLGHSLPIVHGINLNQEI